MKRNTTIYRQSGDKGASWLNAQINIPAASVVHDYKIIIRGRVGQSYHGDTAIDDLEILDGACPGP